MRFLPIGMLKTATHKLDSLQRRAWLPPAILLLALSSVFVFGGDRGYLYKPGPHDAMSEKTLTITANLSLDHHLLMFIRQTLNEAGESIYEPYNRFPIGSYGLLKLTTLLGDDWSAKLSAARMLMLLFFAAAAGLAYLSLRRLISSRWIALTATLMAFSSPYCLYYSDVISNDVMVDLFAVMLVFHGIVIFEQDGRFSQLPIKACIALLLGWHVYGILWPFIVFGLMREVIKARSLTPLTLHQLRHTTLSLIRSRYMALGVIALLFGVSVLTFNFTNEYFALNREVPFAEIPSFRSLTNRIGVDPAQSTDETEAFAGYLNWTTFPERQFYRIGVMALPYIFSPSYVLGHMSYNVIEYPATPPRVYVALGIAVSVASLTGLLFIRRHKPLLTLLALSGFCWALPMRYHTALPWHHFEAVFYIGITLTLFSFILLWLRRRVDERLIAALSVAALLVFIASGLRMAQPINTAETYETHKTIIADLEPIRDITSEKKGQVIWNKVTHGYAWSTVNYHLAGGILVSREDKVTPSVRAPDFIITQVRLDGLASLTPQNQVLFLYEWDAHKTRLDEMIEQAGEPIIRSDFDVYLNGNTLIYAGDDCSNIEDEPNVPFFIAVYPEDEANLPVERRQHGFVNLDFYFLQRIVQRSERCIVIAPPLPDYDIARIYTGQYYQQSDGSTRHTWEGNANLERLNGLDSPTPQDQALFLYEWDTHKTRLDEMIEQAGEPIIRSDFDVYLNGNTLIYAGDDCSNLRDQPNVPFAPFFLAVYPKDEANLPVERRQHGFDNLDFPFLQRIVQRSERCIVIAPPLPDYDIARIYTGQYIQQADGSTQHIWEDDVYLTETAR